MATHGIYAGVIHMYTVQLNPRKKWIKLVDVNEGDNIIVEECYVFKPSILKWIQISLYNLESSYFIYFAHSARGPLGIVRFPRGPLRRKHWNKVSALEAKRPNH